MPGPLQIRQRIAAKSDADAWQSAPWGPWIDVQSPGFLIGYMLPSSDAQRFQYELREAPAEVDA